MELDYSSKGLKAVNFARLELAEGIVEDNCIIIEKDAFKEAVKKLLQEGNSGSFTSKNVIICIPEEKTFSHRMQVPVENAEDEEFITESAKDFIPVELSDAVTDYKLMDKTPDGKNINIDFIAVQKNIVEAIIEILAEVGLKVVFIDVDKNSLIRACDNPMQKSDGDYMVINVDDEQSSFNINGQRGISYTIDLDVGGNGFVEKIKQDLQISTTAEVRSILDGLRKDPEAAKSEIYGKIMVSLKVACDKLAARALEVSTVAETQDSLKVKNIHLVGSYSRVPGLAEALNSALPGVKIIPNFQSVKLNENTEIYYAEAVGLALRAIFPSPGVKEIDLLPVSKKHELLNKMLIPIITKSMAAASVVTALIVLFSGFYMAKGYLDFKISEKEVANSLEKSDSPYLHQAAQASQQRTQMESQVDTILADSVPAHVLIKTMDSYNSNGIDIVNISFQLSGEGSNDMRFRAKTASRTDTEDLTTKLQNNPYFSKVISPLSNLVGKGERFIDIDLTTDTAKMISDYAKSQNPDDAATKQDAVATDSKPNPAAGAGASPDSGASDVKAPAGTAPSSQDTNAAKTADKKSGSASANTAAHAGTTAKNVKAAVATTDKTAKSTGATAKVAATTVKSSTAKNSSTGKAKK